ncbi:MAG: endopeptidase La [Alphaproteobacteria bacterium]|nr:MAG: endopeptidase La [Alphaproteobacteria bacterium]
MSEKKAVTKKTKAVTKKTPLLLPVLPLRDIVVFPAMIVPLFVGRPKSVDALEFAMKNTEEILMLTQKNSSHDNPEEKDLYRVGTVGKILQLLKLPDGTVKVLVEGRERMAVQEFVTNSTYLVCKATAIATDPEIDSVLEPLSRTAISQFESYVKLNPKVSPDALLSLSKIDEPTRLADTIASHLSLKLSDKQNLLETTTVSERIEAIINLMEAEISVLQTERRIRSRVKRQMEKTQREYYLTEQMKAIQKELGDSEDGTNELDEIQNKITATKLPKDSKEKAEAELKKLRLMSPMSSEATVIRNYLEWLLSIPWNKRTPTKKDLLAAEKILNEDHYGLEKVKERILEYLAVQSRVGKVKGPIMCLVGPPGVGKTSLGTSIARATGRNFVRMSLGGVRDESEVRGHRRTYIGAMPGKIIQSMRKAKSQNPLFLLDEIDKLGSDWRGDPSSALLEVLDPSQNSSFNDHYLEVDYDLSDVMFVTTANYLSQIPAPLMDRMEIIRLSGYTEQEKLEIAKRHLIPKQIKDNGLSDKEIAISDDAILAIIRCYTREAGVRNLERELANIMRKSLKKILIHSDKKKKDVPAKVLKQIAITPENLGDFAGIKRFSFGEKEAENFVGVTTGLAWTEVGGELLTLEAVRLPGKGKMKITGKLGEVMQESIQAAASYVRAHAKEFAIPETMFNKYDIHIHVPEGATPKDGPSAGIGMFTSIVSVLTETPVRSDVAMTGEITLRGRVLPIGGLKEKLLAAHRGGITIVIIPKDNEKDLEEIPLNVKQDITIIPVSDASEVLAIALAFPEKPTRKRT